MILEEAKNLDEANAYAELGWKLIRMKTADTGTKDKPNEETRFVLAWEPRDGKPKYPAHIVRARQGQPQPPKET